MKLLLAILIVCLLSVLSILPVQREVGQAVPTPESTPDVCSENPYFAKAIIAIPYVVPPASYNGAAYGHVQLDALYDSLYQQGIVGPVPPVCLVTARVDLTVWTTPGEGPMGTLTAGQTVPIDGRNEDSTWWFVITDFGRGWVSRAEADIQPEAEIDRISILATRP
jgi:hypothetical protein